MFKRILCALICTAVMCTSSFAYTRDVFKDEETSAEETTPSSDGQNGVKNDEASESDGNSQSSNSGKTTGTKVPPGSIIGNVLSPYMRPGDYYYYAFRQILKLYVDNHLYESNETEVLEKMVQNILEENPNYFKFLVSFMLSTLDPYSSYHEADSHFLDVENASAGYGITVEDTGDGTVITSVLKGSNAESAGFQKGDKLISIGGYNVENVPSRAAMMILARPYVYLSPKNEKGVYENYNPECEIIADRNGQQIKAALTRGAMTLDQISSKIVGENNDIAYITISTFLGENMNEEFNKLIYGLEKDGIKKLTIDLRDNGGGSLNYALSMAETFVEDKELLCYYNERGLEEPTPIYSTTPKASFDSITILVNGNTASAAELFTSILQSKGIAKIIGERTYGKSVGQSVYYLANGDYITITTYEILDEKLKSYNGVGIIPDLEIEKVEICYTLPELGSFNHQNYKEIVPGKYSDVTKALEDRLVIMGLMYDKDADGVYDDTTKAALRIYQKNQGIADSGECTYDTVTQITNTINTFKTYTYREDSQYDVAMIVHSSFSQGKRLVKEKEKLAEKNKEMIEARDKAIEDTLDAAENRNKQAG